MAGRGVNMMAELFLLLLGNLLLKLIKCIFQYLVSTVCVYFVFSFTALFLSISTSQALLICVVIEAVNYVTVIVFLL